MEETCKMLILNTEFQQKTFADSWLANVDSPLNSSFLDMRPHR